MKKEKNIQNKVEEGKKTFFRKNKAKKNTDVLIKLEGYQYIVTYYVGGYCDVLRCVTIRVDINTL